MDGEEKFARKCSTDVSISSAVSFEKRTVTQQLEMSMRETELVFGSSFFLGQISLSLSLSLSVSEF